MCPGPSVSAATIAPQKNVASNILLATAGDPSSIGAVRAAALLARRLGASVEVLAVATPFPHTPATGLLVAPPAVMDEESRKAAIENAHAQLREVRGTSQWPVRSAVGWPVDLIAAAARRWAVDLVVVGADEHTMMARMLGTKTAVKAAHHAATPILVVPADFQRAPVNAYAAIDFTPSSINGARLAASLLPPSGTLTLVHMSIFAKPDPEAGTINDLYSRGAHDRLALIARQIARATGRSVKTMTADGTVADVLLSLADKQRGDLIALGSHERGLIDRLVMGSVRSQVLRKSACPVLIVPQQAEKPPLEKQP